MSNIKEAKIEIPKWDGTRETFDTYQFKLRAITAMNMYPEVLDQNAMKACPTLTEYQVLLNQLPGAVGTDPNRNTKVALYKANQQMSGYFCMGQENKLGVNAIRNTMSDDFPLGRVCDALASLQRVMKPRDVTAEIEMMGELFKVRFSMAEDYYNEVTSIMNNYDCSMSDREILKIMATKTGNTSYVILIQAELAKSVPSFQDLCVTISSTQRLAKTKLNDSGNDKKSEKEVSLSNQQDNGPSRKPKCTHCQGQHKRKDCNKYKAALKAQGKCKYCDKEGHLEDKCFVKFPEKKPKWMTEKSSNKSGGETANGNLEIQLTSVEKDFS